MRLSYVHEAPCIRANILLNQVNSRKGFKTIQPEIKKMSDIFGIEFDQHLYKNLFDEIDFKDLKTLLNNKNSFNKIQYFIQEFPLLLECSDFIKIFSQILMNTSNISSALEIFEGLNKLAKLSYENQFKIIISFFYSMNERFSEDAKTILVSKCHEMYKEGKPDQLSQSTVQTLLFLVNSVDLLRNDPFFASTFVNFILQFQTISFSFSNISDEFKQISEIESMLDNTTGDEPIEFEKMINDLGPLVVNSMPNETRAELLDWKLDERRLAYFILCLCKNPSFMEDRENRYMNKIFLQSINKDLSMGIDENSEKKVLVTWNLENVYQLFKFTFENLNMTNVFLYFDDPLFCIKDNKSFEMFLNIFHKFKISNLSLLFNLIFKKWNNELNQIEFLTFLINNPNADLFSFKNYNGRKVKRNFELSISLNKSQVGHLLEAWSCIDLIEVILKLSKGNYFMMIKEMFMWPIANVPELIVLALAEIRVDGDDFLYDEIISDTLPLFLGNHVNSLPVLDEVWNMNKDLVIRTICNMYRSNPDLMSLSRILDITQKLKESLIPIVSCGEHTFTINFAMLAVKRDFLHIDQWLSERISKVGDEFIECLLNYIKDNVISHCKEATSQTVKENILEKCQLSLESLAIIFENLTPSKIGKNPKITQRIEQEINCTYKAIFEMFDELQVQPPNSEEIEEVANKLYQNLFRGEITVEEVTEMMKTYKNSQLHKETEIYACMIHSLLDEYRFFHQYPEKELVTIAILFGQIINQKLLDGIIETVALKYVMEGLKKGYGRMFLFGTTALEQFADKLLLFPQYLQSLTEIKSLKNVPLLYDKICEKLNEMANKTLKCLEDSMSDPGKSGTDINTKKEDPFEEFSDMTKYNQTKLSEDDNKLKQELDINYLKNEKSSFQTQSNVKLKPHQTSLGIDNINQILGNVNDNEISVQSPSQEVIEKLNFIFNSMSKSNLNEKSMEIKAILSDDNILCWFSNIFIVNRVSAENNNHQIYKELISLIDSKELNQLLIKDTILFIKKVLQSENIFKDLKEKTILKNLGSWLGIMTLAKNKPILAKDLDLKEIISDAYENGKLGAIIPFVTRILENSHKTKVFHPKNPWIQAILSILAGLYNNSNLKQNIKFEIDNLFKKLEVDPNSFTSNNLLSGLSVFLNSSDLVKPQHTSQLDTHSDGFKLRELYSRISLLDNYVKEVFTFLNGRNINMNMNMNMSLISKNELLSILTNALTNAINEIISPVVERAVNISLLTTRELILKDFAFEKDEYKFKNAANLCIKALAGSLAMVTCKEPLRISYHTQLKDMLSKKGMELDLIESMNNSLNSTDILEIGCNYIQNYVIKRATDKNERDKVLIEELEKRRKHWPLAVKPELLSKIQSLPEVLRPNISGLTSEEYKIYEDFERDPEYSTKLDISSQSKNSISFLKIILPALKEVMDSYQTLSLTHNLGRMPNKYEICMVNIRNIVLSNESGDSSEEDYHTLSQNIIESKITDPVIAFELACITLKYALSMYKIQKMALANVFSEILRGWIKLHPGISHEITSKVLNNEDIAVRFRLDIHSSFFKKQIFDMNDYETCMSNYLDDPLMSIHARKILTGLLEKNLINLNTFKKIPYFVIDPTLSGNYFDLFSRKSINCSGTFWSPILDHRICNIKDQSTFARFGDVCKFAYNQMIGAMCMYPFQNFEVEKIRMKLKDLLESSFVKNEEQMIVFIMIITEQAIQGTVTYDRENNIYPENVAKCIYCLLNVAPLTMNKLKMFENILFGIFKVLHADYIKNSINFNERPYYKLFVSIIYLLYSAELREDIFNGGYKKLQYFGILADIFRVLNPANYPCFGLAWMDLISNKYFANVFLEIDTSIKLRENIPKYEKYLLLLNDLFSFLKSFSSEPLASYSTKTFVDYAYKFVFLLSKSFPEFLCYYYFIILASLPPGDNFLQMKNIILHCSPKDIDQPDFLLDDLKVDSLPDIRKNSVVLFDIASILHGCGFQKLIDEYIDTKNEAVLDELMKKLNNNKKNKDASNYYVINAIVIYWSQNFFKGINEKKRKNTDLFEFIQKMMKNFDADNRDHLINSILNELRYPSHPTYYFSCLLLFIICDIKNEAIEEHILRNILGRLIYKPYPWGLIVTFFQIWHNPKYEHSKKGYIMKNQCEKIIEDLLKFIKTSKMNKNLDNYA